MGMQQRKPKALDGRVERLVYNNPGNSVDAVQRVNKLGNLLGACWALADMRIQLGKVLAISDFSKSRPSSITDLVTTFLAGILGDRVVRFLKALLRTT